MQDAVKWLEEPERAAGPESAQPGCAGGAERRTDSKLYRIIAQQKMKLDVPSALPPDLELRSLHRTRRLLHRLVRLSTCPRRICCASRACGSRPSPTKAKFPAPTCDFFVWYAVQCLHRQAARSISRQLLQLRRSLANADRPAGQVALHPVMSRVLNSCRLAANSYPTKSRKVTSEDRAPPCQGNNVRLKAEYILKKRCKPIPTEPVSRRASGHLPNPVPSATNFVLRRPARVMVVHMIGVRAIGSYRTGSGGGRWHGLADRWASQPGGGTFVPLPPWRHCLHDGSAMTGPLWTLQFYAQYAACADSNRRYVSRI